MAQLLSPNGYSGIGLIPNASTIQSGNATIAFDPTLPGAKNTKGFNTQIGLGMYQDIELVGRLATNDQRCNMFVPNACPQGMTRDFSAALKWTLPSDWFKSIDSNVALGVNDVGGAAANFKSMYIVGTKQLGTLELSLGQARASAESAMLRGTFSSVSYKPADWLDLNVQKIGSQTWAVAALQTKLPLSNINGYITVNQRMTDSTVTEKKWVGVGVSTSIDSTKSHQKTQAGEKFNESVANRAVANLGPEDLGKVLKNNGFYKPIINDDPKLLKVRLENTAYTWNTVDAIGVALGSLAATHGNDTGKAFELTLTSRGISQAVVTGDTNCLKRWLEVGDVCGSLNIRSGLQRANASMQQAEMQADALFSFENWVFRPELVLSPTLVSSIGTEYGSFDMDGGVNINAVLPLWTGSTIETNRIKPLGMGTRGFEQGGVFFAARLKAATTRTMFHQLVSIPTFNTQVRWSAGTAYTAWDGQQIETSTQSDNGKHRLGIVAGSFKNDTLASNNQKKYDLVTYRFAHDDLMSTVTELTTGKYWAGDKGWSLGQKFWHGDTVLSVYLRRTRMNEFSPLVSFAGLQFSIPLTPRVNRGMEHVALRGTNQWTYTLESRVFDRENLITGGYGEVPRIGESLVQTFNRDRNSTRYLESSLIRAKSAFNELSAQ